MVDDRRAAAARVISLIDLTDLNDAHDGSSTMALVDRALEAGTPAVCLWPEFVADAARRRDEAGADPARLHIATVVNFPSGAEPVDEVLTQTAAAIDDGADEIDVVLPYAALLADDRETATSLVASVADLVHERGRHLKVILETGELNATELITTAAELAIAAGADFIKTSTGKTATGATLDAVDAMAAVIAAHGGRVGLKPSGGIRTVEDAQAMLDVVARHLGDQWATPETFRFGASGLLDDALRSLSE